MSARGVLLGALCLIRLPLAAQGWEAFSEGQEVAGARVATLYLDPEGRPSGARFVYKNGMTADVLRFASVPQVSVAVRTFPVSDKGEPHTQEHLLLGKGLTGKYLNSLLSMSLAEHTAATYQDLTNYQFHTAADKETFYRLLQGYLGALIKPDYTDEEIRREVANLEVVLDPSSNRLRLEEKGTVYNEMVSSMEKADFRNWCQLAALLYGKDNPMALNSGGLPAEIRKISPEDIRKFHSADYHFGGNFSLIAALPESYSPAEFVARLGSIVSAIEPSAWKQPYAQLPPFKPVKGSPIVIGSFPSVEADLPQEALFVWPPFKTPGPREALELDIFLAVLAGDPASYLYKDLVDEKERKVVSGASGVGYYVAEPPGDAAMIVVSGLPPSSLSEAKIAQLRAVLMDRIRSIQGAPEGSGALSEFNAKARSLLSSRRRQLLKFVGSPPEFGFRHSGIAWHRHLESLSRDKGFRKPLDMAPILDALMDEIKAGANPWKAVIARAGLGRDPMVSAVRPEASLVQAEREDKQERLRSRAGELTRQYAAKDDQEALKLYKKELDRRAAELEERDRRIPRPHFAENPPLTLDDTVDWSTATLADTPITVSRFPSTPFIDVSLYFDLSGTPREDWVYLPALPELLTEMGVTTRSGERLDYAGMRERWRQEIYSLGAGEVSNPHTGRLELELSAAAAGPGEKDKALEWLEDCIFRTEVSSRAAGRLGTVLREDIRGLRNIFQLPEENWVREAADAFVYQEDPRWMSVESPFTRLHHLSRLYLRLVDADPRARAATSKALSDLAQSAGALDRASLKSRLEGLGKPLAEVGEYLSAELAWLPEATWRADFQDLARQSAADLSADPAEEMGRLKRALERALTRDRLRVAVVGSPKNTREILPGLEALLSALAKSGGAARARTKSPGTLSARLKARGAQGAPIHVGLVNNSAQTGTFVLSAAGPSYASAGKDSSLDFLAAQVFSGAAPHAFFMQTWSAGLAYSNGVRASAAKGRVFYYAERCPDLTATMRFVTGLAKKAELKDDYFLDYSLANSFADYRGAGDFSSRGMALAADLADGVTPALVRRFKLGLIAAARSKGALQELGSRLPRVLGSVLVGYGANMAAPGAAGFVTGSEALFAPYEEFLRENKTAKALTRIYPRDFWIDP